MQNGGGFLACMETLESDWEQSDVSEDGENTSLEKYQLEADPLDLIQNDIHEMNLQTMHTKKSYGSLRKTCL